MKSTILAAFFAIFSLAASAAPHPKVSAEEMFLSAINDSESALSAYVRDLRTQGLSPSMEIGILFNGGSCDLSLCTWRYTVSTDFYKSKDGLSVFKSLQAEIESNTDGKTSILKVSIKH